MSVNYYLVTDTDGKVIGAQTTRGVISAPNYHLVDSSVYASYASLSMYEGMELMPVANYPAWGVNNSYNVEDVVSYNGKFYRVIQAHTSQAGWTPTAVPALYAIFTPEGFIVDWVAPTGAHDAYPLGALVRHNGEIWASVVASNVWEPSVYGWEISSPFRHVADSRPVYTISTVAQSPVGVAVNIQFDRAGFTGNEMFEYTTPDGRVGLLMVSFENGLGVGQITPNMSGYYRFDQTITYSLSGDARIAVYE